MPNKYSHALVLSHYESRGLISFPHRHKPRPTNTEPSHFERKKKSHPSTSAAKVPSSPPRTPLPPLPPSPCLPTTQDEDSVPSTSHRSTPSIVTEIYAPEQPSGIRSDPAAFQSSSEPEGGQISPITTKGNSLTSETSYPAEATPRTSVSSVRESASKGGDETGNVKVGGFTLFVPGSRSTRGANRWPPKPLQPPPSISSDNHDASKKATSDGGIEETPNEAVNPEKGISHKVDASQRIDTAPPTPLRNIIESPPKPLQAFIDNSKPHSFFYIDSFSTRPWEDDSGTPPILRVPSYPPPGSSGSSSPDDAAPPPISRHRRQIAPTSKKSDRLKIWTKQSKMDRDDRAPPLFIRDLTPEVTPWEEPAEETSEPVFSVQSEGSEQGPNALPGSSSVKSVKIAVPEVKTDTAEASKKAPRRKISRIRGASSGSGAEKKADTVRLIPRDEKEAGGIGARESQIWSDSDEEFLAQFETDGYFFR